MNDIDRSVESMDFAMRRRFAWKEITAENRTEMWNGEIDAWKSDAKTRMNKLNEAITTTEGLGAAYHIGPAYFLKLNNGKFDALWTNHIEGVLKEYLRGNDPTGKKFEALKEAYDSPAKEIGEAESDTNEVVITKPKCDNPNNTEKFTVKDKNALDFLNQVSQQKAKDLCTENPDLIIFSNDEKIDGFESNDSYILKFRDTNGKKYIETSNLMGFFGSGSLLIRIKSRFSPNDDKDLFLHYMLNKVFHFNFIKWETSCGNTSVFDFLLLCFPYYLKKACKKGLFKQYVHREYNDANVRGVINVNRHIRKNIPFAGKIAYRTREFSTDNPVTQLIRHTIEYIRQTSFGKRILSSDNDVKDYVSQICMATPS